MLTNLNEFDALIKKYELEPINSNGKLVLVCPRMPSSEVQQNIKRYVPPEIDVQFVESLRMSTMEALCNLLLNGQGGALVMPFVPQLKEHRMTLKLSGNTMVLEPESAIWDVVKRILVADKYLDGFEIIANGNEVLNFDRALAQAQEKVAKELERRPTRMSWISKDDVTNLSIALNTNSVEEFLKSI